MQSFYGSSDRGRRLFKSSSGIGSVLARTYRRFERSKAGTWTSTWAHASPRTTSRCLCVDSITPKTHSLSLLCRNSRANPISVSLSRIPLIGAMGNSGNLPAQGSVRCRALQPHASMGLRSRFELQVQGRRGGIRGAALRFHELIASIAWNIARRFEAFQARNRLASYVVKCFGNLEEQPHGYCSSGCCYCITIAIIIIANSIVAITKRKMTPLKNTSHYSYSMLRSCLTFVNDDWNGCCWDSLTMQARDSIQQALRWRGSAFKVTIR